MKNEGMKNAYTIGEIGKLFHIGADSLRYYERLGILAPGRGENGYRLYGADDIWRLNIIRDLRELGMSMESIGEYMKNRSLASTRNRGGISPEKSASGGSSFRRTTSGETWRPSMRVRRKVR